MKVCFFGTYEKNYSSNRVIIKGLKKNGIDIIECHVSLWEKYRNKHGNFLKLFSIVKLAFSCCFAYMKLCLMFFSKCKKVDVFVVGYIGQLDILFLKALLLFKKNKPKILFVPLVSLYDTAIIDRGLSNKNNLFAKFLFYIDRFSFKMANLVVFDTNEHIDHMSNLFGLDKDKFKRVWVGADEDVFYPIKTELLKENDKNDKFQVLFIGKYIPLHGLEYIIEAAKLLEDKKDIEFKIVGSGQLDEKIMSLRKKLKIKNIDFIRWIKYDELVNEINKAHIVLGIFGGSDKSLRVIPNKIFQAVACGKPTITGDSLSIRELFTDRKDILLCENRNAESLKSAILELKNDDKLKEYISDNGYKIFKNSLTCKEIGRELLKFV